MPEGNTARMGILNGDRDSMLNNGDLSWITNYIWGIADDVLRDLYVRGKYRSA